METIKWAVNEMPKTDDSQLQVMSLENVSHGCIPWTERGLCKR